MNTYAKDSFDCKMCVYKDCYSTFFFSVGEPTGRRPSTARSIEESTRQRLQDISARRVYVVENGLDLTDTDLTLNASSLMTSSEMGDSPAETKGQNQPHLFKNLINKQVVNKSVIDVRILLIYLLFSILKF
jgi:hypothetical protein